MGVWTIPSATSARRSPVTRRRVLGRRPGVGRTGLFLQGYPAVGSGAFFAVGLVAAHGLGLTPVALLVAGVVVAAATLAYAEGMSMFPDACGSAALARHALDELASFVTGWAACLGLAAAAAAAALFSVHYLSVLWSPLASGWWAAAGAAVVLCAVSAAAILGVERSRRLDGLIGVLDVGIQLLLVLVGLVFVFHPEHLRAALETGGAAPSARQLALAVAIAVVAFAGVESIGDLPGEARDPVHDVRPVTGALLVSAPLFAAALALVGLMAMPVVHAGHAGPTTLLAEGPPGGYRNAPMLGI